MHGQQTIKTCLSQFVCRAPTYHPLCDTTFALPTLL